MLLTLLAALTSLATAISGLLGPTEAVPDPTRSGSPAGAKVFGVSEPLAWRWDPPKASPREIAGLIDDMGGESHRWLVYWWGVERNEPKNGVHQYDFSVYDAMYEADIARGVRPLITVIDAPYWARPPGTTYSPYGTVAPDPEHYDDWAAFVRQVVRRYPLAAGIAVWNEPNYFQFWTSGSSNLSLDPAEYTRLLKVSYGAVKSVDPRMPVLGGSLTNALHDEAPRALSIETFAREMYRNGAAAYMDGLSIHPYPVFPGDRSLFWASVNQARRARAAAGASTPLWFTEVGITSTGPQGVSEAVQAQVLASLYRTVDEQMPDVGGFFVHTLIRPSEDPNYKETGYSLVNGSGAGTVFTPKPAYVALQQEVVRDLSGAAPQEVAGDPSVDASASVDRSVGLRIAAPRPGPGARIGLTLSCREACRVSVRGQVVLRQVLRKRRGGKLRRVVRVRHVRIAPRWAALAAGGSQEVVVGHAGPGMRRALRRSRSAVARLRVHAVDAGGETLQRGVAVRLRPRG